MKIFRPGIVTKLSLLVAFLTAFVSMFVGILVHNGSNEIIFQQALERLKYETNIKSITVLNDIQALRLDALYLAETPPISGVPRAINNNNIDPLDNSKLSDWQRRLETIFSELIRAKSNYKQIRFIGIADHGKEIVRVNRYGSVIRSIPKVEMQQKGESNYYKKTIAINPGEVYLSEITLNREHGKVMFPYQPMIRAATPIYFKGRLFGVVVINMDFSNIFAEFIESTPSTQTPYVINEQGFFLANPDNSKTFGFDLEHLNKISDIYPEIQLDKNNDVRIKNLTYFKEVNGKNNIIHIVKVAFDKHEKNRFIAVALATSNENLLSESDNLRNYVFIMIVIFVFASLLIAFAIAGRFMRPLQKIIRASEDLASGRDVEGLPIDSKDEIGDLARSFNTMNKQLNENEKALIKSQAEIHQVNKMASLGEMASGMAHEINSPIHEINMIAERVIRRGKKSTSKEVEEAMKQVINSVKHISGIIESLRKVSRDSQMDYFELTLVRDITEDVINLSKQRCTKDNISLKITYAGDCFDVAKVDCQRLQITQILINLVNNSFDAISKLKDKWVIINIDINGESLFISVTDSGYGITSELQQKIFEPMYTSKDIGEGTGLGLSISQAIAQRHNGQLTYNSRSENTQFILQIPIRNLGFTNQLKKDY